MKDRNETAIGSRPETDTRDFSPESRGGFQKRLRQGAWVRSGASVFMWFFSLIAYGLKTIDWFAFAGISLAVIYLILINPPTLWVIRWVRQKRTAGLLTLANHFLEIFGYTAIIYFAGGMGRGYLTLLYPALITYVGVMSPRHWPFIVTGCCTLGLSGMVWLQYLGLIPDTSLPLRLPVSYSQQFLDVTIMTAGFLVVAFIASYTSGLLRHGRQQLKDQNRALREARDKLEAARNSLIEKNQALEAAMEKAQASDRMKSEFLANMSHELRTPLNHIIGFSELLADKQMGDLNSAQEDFLNDVLQSGRHLLSLINDILDLSKIEAGKVSLEGSELPLQSLLEGSLVMVKEKALKHNLRLGTRYDELPETLWADGRKLKQILYNLLSNAVKFTPEGGRVSLEARGLNGRGVEITVRDSGIGLQEAELERIFQPFEQGDNSASRQYQGTGLGLSLTKKLVEMHGGRIRAESPGTGQGAAFSFILPGRSEGELP
jgi:signal transduction histidine kinase